MDIHFLKIQEIWLKEEFKALAISLECIPIIALEDDCAVMQY
jgi:hypothetical protein